MSERVFERATPIVNRVLDREACADLADHVARGGGKGSQQARAIGAVRTIDVVERSGLRGRGGAGFPTGVKWRTVARAATAARPYSGRRQRRRGRTGLVKDRDAAAAEPVPRASRARCIAAVAVGAREAVVAMKASFEHELSRVSRRSARWSRRVGATWSRVSVVRGPSAYLFGEETALLEVVEGRQPFPRIAPPYRRGLEPADPTAGASAATVELAGPGGTDQPTGLVDNVETMANLAGILAHGSAWFRGLGTRSRRDHGLHGHGHTRRHGVAEVPMGTPLAAIIEEIVAAPARVARSSRPSRVSPMRSCRRRSSTRRRPTRRWPGSARGSARAVSSSSTTRWIPSPRRTPSPDSSPSSRAVSANRASSTDWPSPITSTPFATRRRPTTTSMPCARRSRRSIAVPAARSPSSSGASSPALLALFPDSVDRPPRR